MAKKLWSAFTDNMDMCYFTGSYMVERHHIYGGANKTLSEKYGFVIPLRPDLHPNGVMAGNQAKDVDIKLKKMCQQYWLENYGTKQQFIDEFQKKWLLD